MKLMMVLICGVLILLNLCEAQIVQRPARHALSAELGKTGSIFHLAYDQKFKSRKFGIRATLGSNFGRWLNAKAFGVGGYYLVGNKNRFLELGADLQYLVIDEVSDDQVGFTIVYPDYSISTFYPSANIGYRRYGRRTLFRAGVSPGMIDRQFFPGGYISFGLLLSPK